FGAFEQQRALVISFPVLRVEPQQLSVDHQGLARRITVSRRMFLVELAKVEICACEERIKLDGLQEVRLRRTVGSLLRLHNAAQVVQGRVPRKKLQALYQLPLRFRQIALLQQLLDLPQGLGTGAREGEARTRNEQTYQQQEQRISATAPHDRQRIQ